MKFQRSVLLQGESQMKILKQGAVCFRVLALLSLFLLFSLIVHPGSALCAGPPIIAGKTQMPCGEQQVLSIMNYQTGNTYTWAIVSGGGSLSADRGERVTYTAPDSNPNCENNPTIEVSCNSEVGSITIALNSCYEDARAYWLWDTWKHEECEMIGCGTQFCGPYHPDECRYHSHFTATAYSYKCTGEIFYHTVCDTFSCGSGGGWCCSDNPCSDLRTEIENCMFKHKGLIFGVPLDVRTEDMKQQGCCPEALLASYEPKPAIPKDIDLGKDPAANEPVCDPAQVGNPISIYNGNNIETEEDLRFSSPNHGQLVFKRFYNSQSDTIGSLGYGWTHTYSLFLDSSYEFEGNEYLKIVDETGRGIYFEDTGSNHYAGAFKERTTVEVEGGNYVWYRLDGSCFAFDPEGRLIWIKDQVGNRQDLTYDASNRLQTVTDAASSRVLTFYYNADGLVDHIYGPVTAAVPDGIWVSYGYDGDQNLVSVTYGDGSGFNYIYGDPDDVHNLTEKKDKMAHLLSTWTYDAQDRAIESFTRDGQGVSIDYVNENEVKVTDAYGITRTYRIWDIDGRKRVTDIEGPAECPECGGDVVRLEYDSALRVIEVEYANGLINQYDDFDSRGNAQTVTLAVGTPEEKTITYTFHPQLNAKLTQTEASVLGEGTKVTIWDYDDDGNNIPNENPTPLLSRKIEQGFTKDQSGAVIPFEYITTYTYTPKGQVLTIDGPQPGTQDTTTFTYDPVTGDLLTVTRPLIGTTTYSEYNAAGEVVCVTDTNGNALTYTYDGRGRIQTITNEADGTTSTYDYNNAGEPARVTQANGVTSDFGYDDFYGRLTRVVDPLGNYIHYDYDDQGNRIELSHFNASDERLYWKRYDYQGTTRPGKLWKEINPDDTYTEYTYDAGGNVHTVKDPAGKTTTYEYDIFNRLTTVTQPGNVVTGYTYDRHNNLSTVTDAEGHTTAYVYDDLGRLIATTSPDTGTTTYAYDAAGNLIAKTDASGNTISYTYDALNRLTGILFPDAAQDITYTYDEGTNGNGRLTSMTDPSGSYTLAEGKTINGVTYTTEYAYDPAGILTGITYPDGRTVTYHLDGAGQVMRVTSSFDGEETTLADNVAHLPFGPIMAMNLGNGLSVSKSFDQLYRMQTSQTGSIYSRSYTYDPAGNVTSIDDLVDSTRAQSFSYDALYRLITASGIYGTISYTYDQVGNRLTKTYDGATDTYSYVPGTNMLDEITGSNPVVFSYDANGNIAGMGDKTFLYNQNNRLIKAAEGDITIGEYIYNALGQRTAKTASGQTTVFIYDQQGDLIAEADNDGRIVHEYIYLDGCLLAGVKSGIEMVQATIDIDPDTLGLNSKGKWITCYIELPGAYDVADIDVSTVVLEGSVYAELRPVKVADHDADGILDLMVKFDRSGVADLLEPADDVIITVDGEVGGILFSGTDTIRVIDKGKKEKKEKKGKKSKKTKKTTAGKSTSTFCATSATTQQAKGMYYYHLDHLGTPQVMTDEDGEVVWKADYRPFGEADVTVNTVENNFRFPGQYYDEETGLHYNYHRYYDPGIGRYLRTDPILQPFLDFDFEPDLTSDIYPSIVINSDERSRTNLTKSLFSSNLDALKSPAFIFAVPGIIRFPEMISSYIYVQNNPLIYWDPKGYGLIDFVRCFYWGGKISKLQKKCKDEMGTTFEEECKFYEKYGGASPFASMWNCVERKDPGLFQKWAKNCFKGGWGPNAPVRPKPGLR